jgi:hypothetical protein
MSEPERFQGEPSVPPPKPSDIQDLPFPQIVQASVVELKKCPHCGHSLTAKDVEGGKCWFCEKKLTDPVEPKKPGTPFYATFLLGLAGAISGMVFGFTFLGEKARPGSWTLSLCGGIGLATGSAIANLLFGKQKQEP